MNDLSSYQFTLYQWPAAKGVESIYPRCVIFHRLLNLLNINFSTANVGLPILEETLDPKLKELLIKIPILKVRNDYFKSSNEIVNFLISCFDKNQLDDSFKIYVKTYNAICYQWANEIFLNTLLYARWINEDNYQRFIKNVDWGDHDQKNIEEAQLKLREQVIKYIKKYPVGNLNQEEYESHLRFQLMILEDCFSENKYFVPSLDHLSISDLACFMVVQGLLSEDLSESEYIKKYCPNTLKWAQDIDEKTKGPNSSNLNICLF